MVGGMGMGSPVEKIYSKAAAGKTLMGDPTFMFQTSPGEQWGSETDHESQGFSAGN